MFKKVRINKQDTCLTYVMKRLGVYNQEEQYSLDIYDTWFISKPLRSSTILKPGDVIMWTNKEYTQDLPIEITEDGLLITHKVLRGRHLAVIERVTEDNKIYYSDCTRKNSDVGIPQLNIKNLLEQRLPDFILTLKDEYKL